MSVDRHVDAIGEVQLFLKAHSKTIADTLYGLQQQKAPEASAVGDGCQATRSGSRSRSVRRLPTVVVGAITVCSCRS